MATPIGLWSPTDVASLFTVTDSSYLPLFCPGAEENHLWAHTILNEFFLFACPSTWTNGESFTALPDLPWPALFLNLPRSFGFPTPFFSVFSFLFSLRGLHEWWLMQSYLRKETCRSCGDSGTNRMASIDLEDKSRQEESKANPSYFVSGVEGLVVGAPTRKP